MRIKCFLTFVLCFVSSFSFSQDFKPEPDDFNKWSVDGAVGFTKTYSSFASGFRNNTTRLFATELSMRYMFNEFLGVKADFGFHSLKNAYRSQKFNSDQYRYSIQAVVNAGRLFRFEDWTKKINVLMHSGVGVGSLYNDAPGLSNNVDDVMVFIVGSTLQVKTSSRTALNFDAGVVTNLFQNHEFAGGEPNKLNLGILLTGSVGLSVYIGKKEKHADWYVREEAFSSGYDSKIQELESKIESSDNEIENKNIEFRKLSRQVELLEEELGIVRNKLNKQEELIRETKPGVQDVASNNDTWNIYFNFNSVEIIESSYKTIISLSNKLKNNPGLSIVLEGYADESGDEDYNLKLSEKRAERIKKYLMELGADENNIFTVGKGEVSGSGQKSKLVKQFARRVSVNFIELYN